MENRANHYLIKILTATVLAIWLFLPVKATVASVDANMVAENLMLSEATESMKPSNSRLKSDAGFARLSNTGSYSYLAVDVKQTSGANGEITVRFVGQKLPGDFQSSTKCYYMLASEHSNVGGTTGIFSGETEFPPIETGTEITLSPSTSQQALTGTFSIDASGTYTFFAELPETNIRGASTVTFQLQDNFDLSGTTDSGEKLISDGDTFLDQISEWIKGFSLPEKAGFIPLIMLLVVFSALFIWLLYINFIKRIPGSFVVRCECGATRFNIGMKSPRGRSITLYKLLDRMLKQHEDHDADVVKGIANDNDNKKQLSKIRIYIVKDSDKRPHYAFLKAGSNEFIDDTIKQVYPDSGRLNTKLKVCLSFIEKQGNQSSSAEMRSKRK